MCLQDQSDKRATFDDLLRHTFLAQDAIVDRFDIVRAGLDVAESVLLNTKKSFRLSRLCNVIGDRYKDIPARRAGDDERRHEPDHQRAP